MQKFVSKTVCNSVYKLVVSIVFFQNLRNCSADCRDWSIFVRSSPLYKRAHGEDIIICTSEMRIGGRPAGRFLNRLFQSKADYKMSI
ncbi:hypothetical protein T10_12464, partial [Trichinella papuae]